MESGHRFDAQTLLQFYSGCISSDGGEEQEAKLVADHFNRGKPRRA